MNEECYRLIGSTASPYALKLRALLRYRRIPFDSVIVTKALRKQTEHLRPNLIPILQYPDGSFRGETTALVHDLEARHSDRFVILEDKASVQVSGQMPPTAPGQSSPRWMLNIKRRCAPCRSGPAAGLI